MLLQLSQINIPSIMFGTLLAAVVSFIVWRIQQKMTAAANLIAEGHKKLLDRVAELEKKDTDAAQTVALLKQEMLPISEFMKRKLLDALLHPSAEFVIPDAVLRRLMEKKDPLTEAEFKELNTLVAERIASPSLHVSELERLQAQALPIMVRIAELEAELAPESEITEVQLVTTTAKSPETKKREENQ